jgi:hypothetical protein
MCHLRIAIDQSIHSIKPLFDEIEGSAFFIRSVRVAPVGWSRKADVYLSLGGGSKNELSHLLDRLHTLPAVVATDHIMPPI